jgi:hypothetical protein
MPLPLIAVLVTSQLALAADSIPKLDTRPSCRAAAAAAIGQTRNAEVCQRDEDAARDKLKQDWSGFTAAQRVHCTSLSRMGGSPSYVELLTCLEMAKAAASLPAEVKKGRVVR